MMHFQCKINILYISESPGGGVTLKREIFSVYGGAIFYVAGLGERSVNGGDNVCQIGIECGCGGGIAE